MMQAFQGRAMATPKLHHATRHLLHHIACQRPSAHFFELWIEHIVLYLKRDVRDRVREHPELIFVHDHLLTVAAAKARAAHLAHNRTAQELGKAGHAQQFSAYDEEADGVLLLDKRAAVDLLPAEADVVLDQFERCCTGKTGMLNVAGQQQALAYSIACMPTHLVNCTLTRF